MPSIPELRKEVNGVAKAIDGGYSDDPNTYRTPKVIRDAVWNFYEIQPPFLTLLDSPFLQRLRFISQTAFTISTYPCAQHSRFEHTLGVFHATKMVLDALEKYSDGVNIEEPFKTETKLAALLHDIGHGPFSHTSETVYKYHDVFQDEPERFMDASASEILSYCLIESEPVQAILDQIADQIGEIDSINSDRISNMILAHEEDIRDEYKFLRYIINGPFDADKFDYINRDGYFTGLNINLDVQRLLQGLRVSTNNETILVDFKSLSALEQVFIAKSQLYSQVYHHHKIRAASTLVHRFLHQLIDVGEEAPADNISGYTFDNPATYLLVDETDLLGNIWDDSIAQDCVRKLKQRQLPNRALVISHESFPETREGQGTDEDLDVTGNWQDLMNRLGDNPDFLERSERNIGAKVEGSGHVYIDIPSEAPGGDYDKTRPKIQLGRGGEVRDMSEVFPADSWKNTYETYRQRNYIFSDADDLAKIADGALEWLHDYGIKVKPLSVLDAKIELDKLEWDNFLE